MNRYTIQGIIALSSIVVLVAAYVGTHNLQQSNVPRRVSHPIEIFEPQQLADIRNSDEMQRWFDHIEITCITLALYGETRGSVYEDQRGVAHVLVNRMRSEHYPSEACQVITEPWQIESVHTIGWLRELVNKTIQGIPTLPNKHPELEQRLYQIAKAAYYDESHDPTVGALYFWSPKSQYQLGREAPAWSKIYTHVADLGDHKYYVR